MSIVEISTVEPGSFVRVATANTADRIVGILFPLTSPGSDYVISDAVTGDLHPVKADTKVLVLA